jgi:hypothetical protein
VKRVSPDEETMALWLGKVVGLEFQGKFRENGMSGEKDTVEDWIPRVPISSL